MHDQCAGAGNREDPLVEQALAPGDREIGGSVADKLFRLGVFGLGVRSIGVDAGSGP
jgi:hypothetical protein